MSLCARLWAVLETGTRSQFAAELGATRRIFALVLGPVATRGSDGGAVTAEQVGSVAVTASTGTAAGRIIGLHDGAEVDDAVSSLSAS